MPTGDPPGLEPPGETEGKPRGEVGPSCGPVPAFPFVLSEREAGVVSADWQGGRERASEGSLWQQCQTRAGSLSAQARAGSDRGNL